MTRISWYDAYPDHPDRQSVAWATVETDDALWDIPVDPSTFPTRPTDSELLPIPLPHKHDDGHWCESGACEADIAYRTYSCWACQLERWRKEDRMIELHGRSEPNAK